MASSAQPQNTAVPLNGTSGGQKISTRPLSHSSTDPRSSTIRIFTFLSRMLTRASQPVDFHAARQRCTPLYTQAYRLPPISGGGGRGGVRPLRPLDRQQIHKPCG